MRIRPTAEGRIGIWVAQFRGDDETNSAQREFIQKLNLYIENEKTLKGIGEVRSLPKPVVEETYAERTQKLEELHKAHNASLIITGEIFGFEEKELHLTISIAKQMIVRGGELRLTPVTKEIRRQEQTMYLGDIPQYLTLPPKRVRQTLELARIVAALALFQKAEFASAAREFDAVQVDQVDAAIDRPNLSHFTGLSWQLGHILGQSESKDDLKKAIRSFEAAAEGFGELGDRVQRVEARLGMGTSHWLLAESGESTAEHLARAAKIYQSAYDDKPEDLPIAMELGLASNLAGVHFDFARLGADREVHLAHALAYAAHSVMLLRRDTSLTPRHYFAWV